MLDRGEDQKTQTHTTEIEANPFKPNPILPKNCERGIWFKKVTGNQLY